MDTNRQVIDSYTKVAFSLTRLHACECGRPRSNLGAVSKIQHC